MGKREKKIAIIQEYLPKCNSVYPCYVYGHIPKEQFQNACASYAGHVKGEDVFGLIDETLFGSGKKGFLFTVDGFYSSDANSLYRYDSGTTYRSLPSSYNLTLFNEMLTELYEIETAPTGWDIAGGLLDLATSFLDEWNTENASNNTTASNNVIESSEPLLLEQSEDDEETIDLDAAKEYVKEILLQTGDVIECEEDELDTFIEEAKALLNLMEDSDGDYEQAIDELLADEEHPKQMQKATTKCQQGLELYLPDLEDEPEQFETCQRIVRKYQQTVKQIRAQLKQL